MKIGVIGAGNMGKNHIRNLKEIEGVELVGYYDPIVEINAKKFVSIEELVKNCDAIDIVTPTSTHYQTALKCVGKDIFVEKPLCSSVKECEILKEKFKDNILMVGQIERFNPIITKLKKAMEKENILAVEIHRCSPYDKRIEVSVMEDLMIHDIDLISYLLNEKMNDFELYKKDVFGKDDYCQIIGKTENGINYSLTASRITQNKIRQIQVHCKNSYMEADLLNGSLNIHVNQKSTENGNITYEHNSHESKIILINNLKTELEHFKQCILERKEPLTNVDDAISNMKVIEKIRRKK